MEASVYRTVTEHPGISGSPDAAAVRRETSERQLWCRPRYGAVGVMGSLVCVNAELE